MRASNEQRARHTQEGKETAAMDIGGDGIELGGEQFGPESLEVDIDPRRRTSTSIRNHMSK
jgi:hypothetical protein